MDAHYRREIDGLRAVSLLAVMAFHAKPAWLPGGFVGVDVFFVISGFLITKIILEELECRTFSMARFYQRRVRRLAPALLLVLVVTSVSSWFWLLPADLASYGKSLAATLLFASNIYFWTEAGYFDTAAELKPLLHTWSLSIEEQFYLLFPTLMLLAWRFNRKCLLPITILIAVLGLVMAERRAVVNPIYTYFLLPTRGWELLVGSVAAQVTRNQNYLAAERWQSMGLMRHALGTFGLAMIVFATFTYSKSTPFPGLYALVPTVGAALILLFGKVNTVAGRLLSQPILVGVGLISYSGYLWHQPVFAFARHRSIDEPDGWIMALLGLLVLFLAALSWKFIEMPFRREKTVAKRRLPLLLVPSFALGAFGVASAMNQGFQGRQLLAHLPSAYTAQKWLSVGSTVGIDGVPCISGERPSLCQVNASQSIKKYLLIGDSHSADLTVPYREFLYETGYSGWQLSFYACGLTKVSLGPNSKKCAEAVAIIKNKVTELQFDTIIVATNLSSYFETDFESSFASYQQLLENLAQTGARVVVLSARPNLTVMPARAAILNRFDAIKIKTSLVETAIHERLLALENQGVIRVFHQDRALMKIGCGAVACFNGHTPALVPLYRDTNHLTDFGAKKLFAELKSIL